MLGTIKYRTYFNEWTPRIKYKYILNWKFSFFPKFPVQNIFIFNPGRPFIEVRAIFDSTQQAGCYLSTSKKVQPQPNCLQFKKAEFGTDIIDIRWFFSPRTLDINHTTSIQIGKRNETLLLHVLHYVLKELQLYNFSAFVQAPLVEYMLLYFTRLRNIKPTIRNEHVLCFHAKFFYTDICAWIQKASGGDRGRYQRNSSTDDDTEGGGGGVRGEDVERIADFLGGIFD